MEGSEVLEGAEVLKYGLLLVEDDNKIVDYLIDSHGKSIVSDFDHRPENTGVALFFDDTRTCKDLVLVLRMKYFKEKKDNGLLMLVVQDLYCNAQRKEFLIQMLRESFDDNTVLRDEVISSIEVHAMKSVEVNA